MVDTLEKLKQVESELAEQEKELNTQLEGVKAKLGSIRSVLPMFSGESEAESTDIGETVAEVVESEEPKQTTPKRQTKQKATSKGKSKKKKDGRAAAWQKYVRPGVKNESIPDAVKLVLATQPEKEFKIAEVMEALFKDDMPKSQYLKARNRISNVLSGGVRAGDWYRGGRSSYTLQKGG